ncbi:uncharacterized protein [Physcomitrium patens]|uniref:Nuclear nucleic acid-binding protein C1D n=1 Tax=Physcomitrium patens TaxID=3218 RepID=A9RV03_PHYPA|nr:uncharacterized protein LOC112294702 [Physcomitrium patens]PNR59871.1 hypothetical protein PHYPA_002663 [Physcomitrium patens]|eukprot:XP_024401229.1 uncharacterized protein LOC112294702 [Physcomitrella patens]
MADLAIPAVVQRNVSQLEIAVSDLQRHIRLLTSPESRESIQLLSPADRASYFLAIAKAANALFCLHLRTTGQDPEKHGVKSELERVSVYNDKVAAAIDRSMAPSRPTSAINVPAANRFIEHAIPDLTEEQKQKVREISRGGKRSMTWVRNPNEDSQTKKKLSVSEAAAAFLAEATKDLVPTAPRQNPLPDI